MSGFNCLIEQILLTIGQNKNCYFFKLLITHQSDVKWLYSFPKNVIHSLD